MTNSDFTDKEKAWVREQYNPRMQCFEEMLEEINNAKTKFYNALSLDPLHVRFDNTDYEITRRGQTAKMNAEVQHILRGFYYVDLQEALIELGLLNKVDFESAYATGGDIIIYFIGGFIEDANYNEGRKVIATKDKCIRLSWLETDAYYREKFGI